MGILQELFPQSQGDYRNSLLDLLEFCLSTTYFTFRDDYYKQVHGCAMGSPVSPIMANIFMEKFEEKVLEECPCAPKVWYRFVDDTFSIIQKDHLEPFTEYINRVNDHISFTREEECDSSLPFLDTRVTVKANGELTTTVYRKPTHTGSFLKYDSHHPLHQKLGVVRTLSHRARVVCSDTSARQKELDNIKDSLSNCDYPEWIIRKGQKEQLHHTNQEEPEDEHRRFACVPFVKGVTEPITRILQDSGFKVAMKPHRNLRQELVAPKDPVKDKLGVVYEIDCAECDAKYVGQTGRNLSQRVKEHRTATEKGQILKSGIAQHAWDAHHDIAWDNIKVLEQEPRERRRQIKEALLIKQHAPRMNRDCGIDLPPVYNALVPKTTTRGPQLPREPVAPREPGSRSTQN